MKKEYGVFVFSAIVFFFAWFLLRRGVVELNFILLPVGILLLLVVWGMFSLLIERFWMSLVLAVVALLEYLILWLFLPSAFQKFDYYLITLSSITALLFISLLFGFKRANRKKTTQTKIELAEIIPAALDWFYFAIAIIISFSFFLHPKIQDLQKGIEISPSFASKLYGFWLPESEELTVDEMLNQLIGKNPDFTLSKQERQRILEQLGLGDLDLSGKEKLAQIPKFQKRIIENGINQLLQKLGPWASFLAALLLFQIALWLGKLFVALSSLFCLIIFIVLRRTGWLVIETKLVDKETIVL